MTLRRLWTWVTLDQGRSWTAKQIRMARRERDWCLKQGWDKEAAFCGFRARMYYLLTYYSP